MKISRRQALGAAATAGLGVALPGTAAAMAEQPVLDPEIEKLCIPWPEGAVWLTVLDENFDDAKRRRLMVQWHYDAGRKTFGQTLAYAWSVDYCPADYRWWPSVMNSIPERFWFTKAEAESLPTPGTAALVVDDESLRRKIERRVWAMCANERRCAAIVHDLSWMDWDGDIPGLPHEVRLLGRVPISNDHPFRS